MLDLEEKRIFFKRFGYEPSADQLMLHSSTDPVILAAGGERAGKSRSGSADMSAEVAGEPDLYWIVGPDYEQATAEFDYLAEDLLKIDAVAPDAISSPKTGSRQLVTRAGARVQTKTSAEVMKIASFAPKGILMVEAAQQDFQAFKKLRNRIREKRGWLKLTGTFESSVGWYADMWKELQLQPNVWQGRSISLPTWGNLAIYPGGRTDPEILAAEASMTEEEFLERFGGVPCPPAGVVFKTFRHIEHVVPVHFAEQLDNQPNPKAPLRHEELGWILPNDTRMEIWIDPGYAGAYAVGFFAIWGGLVFQLDEVYERHTVAEQVILRAMTEKGYLWQRVRKDASKHGYAGVIDIAARQHQGMESHEEVWRRVGGVLLRSQGVKIADGISRHRTFLRDPMTQTPRIFHDPKCVEYIREYGKYKYPKMTDGRATTELPIDKDNHGMKTIAYGLVANFGYVDEARPREAAPVQLSREEQEIERAFSSARGAKEPTGWLA